MGRHEIRLRRQRMTSRRIESHKNYHALLEKHEKKNRGRRVLRMLLYIFILLGLALIIFISLKKIGDNDATGSVIKENISRPGISHDVKSKMTIYGKS